MDSRGEVPGFPVDSVCGLVSLVDCDARFWAVKRYNVPSKPRKLNTRIARENNFRHHPALCGIAHLTASAKPIVPAWQLQFRESSMRGFVTAATRFSASEPLSRAPRSVREEIVCAQEAKAHCAAARPAVAGTEDLVSRRQPSIVREFAALSELADAELTLLGLGVQVGLLVGSILLVLGLDGMAAQVTMTAGASIVLAACIAAGIFIRRHLRWR